MGSRSIPTHWDDNVVFGLGLKSESSESPDTPVVFFTAVGWSSGIRDSYTLQYRNQDHGPVYIRQELSNFGGELAAACQLINISNITQGQQKHPSALQIMEERKLPLILNCEIRTNGVVVEALVDPSAVSIEMIRMILQQMTHSFRAALNHRPQATLDGDLRSVSPQGLADLMEKGIQPPPPLVHGRAHDIICAKPTSPVGTCYNCLGWSFNLGDTTLLADDVGKETHLQSIYVLPSDACHGFYLRI
ncbi:AMP-dependent synthetase/ligase [Penicillium fimorum]|uniref:AMP-dependent synthetase/ligase n=1 Tax=Penicillium fimorum TaxID=1882269 RepID=A0A9W9XVF6_9EURO|nr:AMP-dependent synthetase/ligase [Penicillium fimorum]